MPSLREKLAGQKTKLANRGKKVSDHPAALNNYQAGTFINAPVEMIKPNPFQPRQVFDEESIQELAQSIKEKGVIQPIAIQVETDQSIILIAGERRLRAAKIAGLETVPAFIINGDPAEIALIENLHRENLKPIEEAEAYQKMIVEHNYTQEQLSQVIGKARTTITEALSINKLPDEIKDECRRADIPKRALVEVSKQKTKEAMISLFKKIRENNLKSDQVRDITRKKPEPRPPAVITIIKIDSLIKSINKLNTNDLEDQERIELHDKIKELGQALEGFLD